MSRLKLRLTALLLACALSGGGAVGEDGATLRGMVTDKQGNPMPGSTITVRSKSNPSVNNQGTLTNAKGEYRLPLLPPGNDYEITCAFPGFSTIIKRPVDLDAGKVTTVDFILTEELVQVIKVEAKGDIVDTEKTTTSTSVNTEFIAGLPILGRNYSDVLTLAPGVTDTDGDGQPNVKGAREVDFQLRISNVQTNDPFGGGRALDFNIEAIEEIQILTGALTAEYSSQGGVGLVTTKSGGNEFEGSFKVFVQSRSIDGDGANNNDITDTHITPPSFRTLRPFLTAGGALKKDRLWYYTAIEYLDEQEPVIFGPATRLTSREGHRDFAKLTWQMNPENKANFEFYYEPTDTTGNNIGPTIALESDLLFDTVSRLYTVRETAVFSPTMFLDSTLSLFQTTQNQYPTRDVVTDWRVDRRAYELPPEAFKPFLDFLDRNQFSILGGLDEGYIFNANSRAVQGPFWINQRLDADQWSLREDLSFYVDDFLGSHSLKTGLEIQRQEHQEVTEFRPFIVHDDLLIRGGDFFNWAAPIPPGDVPLDSERLNIGFYVQDTWKPVPNLTLTLGLRLDREVVEGPGRTPFDPAAEVAAYNELARQFYNSPDPAGNESGAQGQIVLPNETDSSLNFEINPLTDTFFCDLDGDGTCNGRTSPDGTEIPGVRQNSDTAFLHNIFHRDPFDCSRRSGSFNPQPSRFDGSAPFTGAATGRECIGNFSVLADGSPDFLREGTDLLPDHIELGNTNFAPRFSVSYDPFADGKTKLYATWGRFYGFLFLGTVVSERRADFQSIDFTKSKKELTKFDGLAEGGFTMYQVSRDLRTPFTDEFTFGLERELAPELAIKAIYTERKGRDQLQDKDVNHVTVDRLGATSDSGPDGILDDCLDGLDSGASGCNPDAQPDIEPLNPNFNQIFFLGNFNRSEYRSLELVLTKRLHRNWQFDTSYTWSEARGNAEDFLSLLGDDPSQTELEEGFLAYDQRHVLKFNAVAHLPKEFQVGGTIQYESGLPFNLINRDFVSDRSGNTSFRTIFPTGQRNDLRNKSFWTFNANVKKGVTFGGRVKGTISFDVFDILNSDDLRIFSVNQAIKQGLQISDPVDPAERQFGRRFQIGIELNF